MKKIRIIMTLALIVTLLLAGRNQSQAAVGERYFPETGHSIVGAFKSYWEQHGGLERFGYPLSDEIAEVSDLNGQTYAVQYFERAEFEHHPENAAPYDVLLTQLGSLRYHQLYPNRWTTEQVSTDSPTLFAQTGKHVGRLLLNAWQRLGGLANIGYPISEELAEQSPLDGNVYLVQYFERAEFEYHPGNQPPNDVLLTQLGRFAYAAKYGPKPAPQIQPPHLNIPPQPNWVQTNPQISETFLVWSATRLGPDKHELPNSADIFALDLFSNNLITVTDAPCDQSHPVLSDFIVVWQDANDNGSCSYNKRTIYAKDLESNQLYEVATNVFPDAYPTVSNQRVVWDEHDASSNRLMSLDLASGTRKQIVSYPTDTGIIIGPPLVSNAYIVWTEAITQPGGNPGASWLKSYNLATHAIKTLQYVANDTYTVGSLDANKLLWSTFDDSTYLTDLDKGTSSPLPHEAAGGTLYGDTVVWSMQSPTAMGRRDLDIWGLKLDDLHPVPLVSADGDQYNPTFGNPFADGWLVWQNDHGPNDGRLDSVSLNYAFATASQRAKGLPSQSFTTPLLLDQGISSGPLVAGSTVFWAKPNIGVQGYTDTGERFAVSTAPGATYVLATDDTTLVWGELFNGQAIIHAYDINTRQEISAFDFPSYNGEGLQSADFAIANGMLYYSHYNHVTKGFSLYVRNLVSGQEQVVKDNGVGPVVSDGYLLWREIVCHGTGSFACAPPETTIHMRRLDGSQLDKVIATEDVEDTFSYGVSGDNVMWSLPYIGPDVGVHLYSISKDTTQSIFGGSVFNSAISGNTVAWAYKPTIRNADGLLLTYDIATRVITPITTRTINTLALSQNVLAYCANGGYGLPCNLYLTTLSDSP